MNCYRETVGKKNRDRAKIVNIIDELAQFDIEGTLNENS